MGSYSDLQRAVRDLDPRADLADQAAAVTRVRRLAQQQQDALGRAMTDEGRSYAEIGRALGMSRQAAAKRYPK